MALVRIRLCDWDRQRWGEGEELPDELTLDTEWYKDLDVDTQIEWDRETDLPLGLFVGFFEAGALTPAQYRLVAIWLALRMAGHEVAWKGFSPKVWRATIVHEVPAGPPVGPSEPSSEDVAADS